MSLEEDPAETPIEDRVRAQLADLEEIDDRPLSEHAERYDQIHEQLQAALSDIDDAGEG